MARGSTVSGSSLLPTSFASARALHPPRARPPGSGGRSVGEGLAHELPGRRQLALRRRVARQREPRQPEQAQVDRPDPRRAGGRATDDELGRSAADVDHADEAPRRAIENVRPRPR